MARKRHTAPATTGSAQHEDAEQTIRALRDKIEWLDVLAGEMAGTINALARAARTELKSGDDITVVYHLLFQISEQADSLAGNVSYEANEVGAAAALSDYSTLSAGMQIFNRWRHVKNADATVETSHA